MNEKTISWYAFNEKDKAMIAKAMSEHTKYKRPDWMLRMLELGKPSIVMGKNDTGMYMRIAPESEDVMRVIFDNYQNSKR